MKTQTKAKARFQQPDIVADARSLVENSTDETGIRALAHKYDECVKHYYHRSSRVLNPYMAVARLEQRKRLLLNLIEQSAMANTTPEMFMKAQFEQLSMFLPNVFPALEIVASDKAPKRWASYVRRMKESFITPTEEVLTPDAQWYMEQSVAKMCARLQRSLKILGSLNDVLFATTLEVMARSGDIKGEYIVTLDERWIGSSEYVANLASETMRAYRPGTIQKLAAMRKQLVDNSDADERVKQYA